MADDFTSNPTNTGTVAVDGEATGRINRVDFSSDTDWFQVILVAGQTYQIDVKGSPTGDGTLDDPVLVGVYDGSSRFIRGTGNDDGGEGYNSQITYTALADGIHFVSVRGYEDEIGTYTVSVTDVTDTAFTDDFAATTATTGAVTVDGSVRGEIETAGDHDWFAVDLTAGTTYQIDLKGLSTGDGTLWITYLAGVYTSASTSSIAGTAAGGGGDGLNSRLEFTPTSNGIHYVAAGGISSDTGTYRLSVSVKEEVPIVDDHSATRQTTGMVLVDGSVTGEIETGNDRDWFKVELDAGTRYQIDLKGSRTGDGTLEDPYLRGVYNSNGNLIGGTTNDDGGRGYNSRLTFTPTANGTHYVAAGARGSDTGTYTLSVTDLTDDYSATRGTTGEVDVDSSVMGEIDYRGDRDWFEVTLEEGATYEIYLEGSPTGNGTLRDPYLRGVYDRNGNRIAGTTDDDGGVDLNSEVEFTAQYSGRPLRGGRRPFRLERHLHADGVGRRGQRPGPGRLYGRDRDHRRGGGGRLGDGRDRLRGRPRLVRGGARCGQDLPDRPQGLADRGRHPDGPVPARGLRREWRSHRRYREQQRRHGPQQPGGIHGG